MLITSSRYADRLKPVFGVPTIAPVFGETFDANNDLTLSYCGTIVYHRDGHVTRGTFRSVTSDSMIEYDRRHMTKRAFNDCYGVDEESSILAMLHGDFA